MVKSSQVNILILDFYLLKLSKYKQTKKKKTDEEFFPQIENKVWEPSSQLSWNFSRVQYGAYKSSYVENISHHMLRTLLNPQNTKLKRKYLAFTSWK